MGEETVEDESMWTTNEGEKFTKEILKYVQVETGRMTQLEKLRRWWLRRTKD